MSLKQVKKRVYVCVRESEKDSMDIIFVFLFILSVCSKLLFLALWIDVVGVNIRVSSTKAYCIKIYISLLKKKAICVEPVPV